MPEQTPRPHLQVVANDGSLRRPRVLLDLPATLRARPPFGADPQCRVRVSREDLRKSLEAGRYEHAVSFFTLLANKPPPAPTRDGAAGEGITALMDACACFLGVKRPFGAQDAGADVAAYILRPGRLYMSMTRGHLRRASFGQSRVTTWSSRRTWCSINRCKPAARSACYRIGNG